MKRAAYIAGYDHHGIETVLARDVYWSPELSKTWDVMADSFSRCPARFKLLQGWYSDSNQVQLVRSIKA